MVTPGGEYYPRHQPDHQYQEQTHLGDQDRHQEHQEHRRHQSGDKQEQAGQARQQQVGLKEDNFWRQEDNLLSIKHDQ